MRWLLLAIALEILLTLWYYEQEVLSSPPDDFGVGMLFWLIVVTFAGIDLVWFAVLAVRAWAGVLG